MTSIMSIRRGIVAAALAVLPQVASAQSTEELMAIIQEQQRQIEELSRKVDALQEQTASVAGTGGAATSVAVTTTGTTESAGASAAEAAPAEAGTEGSHR